MKEENRNIVSKKIEKTKDEKETSHDRKQDNEVIKLLQTEICLFRCR